MGVAFVFKYTVYLVVLDTRLSNEGHEGIVFELIFDDSTKVDTLVVFFVGLKDLVEDLRLLGIVVGGKCGVAVSEKAGFGLFGKLSINVGAGEVDGCLARGEVDGANGYVVVVDGGGSPQWFFDAGQGAWWDNLGGVVFGVVLGNKAVEIYRPHSVLNFLHLIIGECEVDGKN